MLYNHEFNPKNPLKIFHKFYQKNLFTFGCTYNLKQSSNKMHFIKIVSTDGFSEIDNGKDLIRIGAELQIL